MKILSLSLAGLAATIGFAQPALAFDWQYVTTNTAGAKIYIDTQSISRNGDSVEAWYKWDYAAATPDPKRAYAMEKDRVRHDCKASVRRLLNAVEYNADGSVRKSYDFSTTDNATSAVQPDSIGSALMKAACSPVAPPPG